MTDAFEDRRRVLEEEFFKKQNEALLKKMKDAAQRAATRDELRTLTGIAQEHLLDALSTLKVGSSAALVISMFPLIEVAWADGKVSEVERKVLLEQANSLGIKTGTPAANFLAQWLEERPDASWEKLWFEYVGAVCEKMPADDKALLKAEVMGRARHVAEASGGVLGLGWQVSSAEQKVLDTLSQAFR